MRCVAITDPGLEDVVVAEVGDRLGVDAEVWPTTVTFDASLAELCSFTYRAQSIRRTVLLHAAGEVSSLDDVCSLAGMLDISEYIEGTFRVTCERVGEHDFSSHDIEQEVGAVVVDETGAPVDLEAADVVVFVYIYEERAYLGIDLAGRDLSQREYKVFSHPESIRGNVAYALLQFAAWQPDEVLLDPFAGSGMIPIEAAHTALNRPVHEDMSFGFRSVLDVDDGWFDVNAGNVTPEIHAFDNNRMNLRYGEKNAKVAVIEDAIHFSKKDVEWLDVSFDEGEVDAIVTQPPAMTKRRDRSEIERVYDELFYQAEFVLSDEGRVVALLRETEAFVDAAKKHGFTVEDTWDVRTGSLAYTVVYAKP
jgi:23S rRNA G2445 N2-methylase RlmL